MINWRVSSGFLVLIAHEYFTQAVLRGLVWDEATYYRAVMLTPYSVQP